MQNGHPVIQLKGKLGTYCTMVLSKQANQANSELSLIVVQIMLEPLLSGPDLTIQLAGVLIRFHTEEVAFMGDIEAM